MAWLIGSVPVGCLLHGVAAAQSAASDFTFGTRYDAVRRVTGTIAPDPDGPTQADGSGSIRYAAVRNSYDDAGRLWKIESGELANWQSESVAPASWADFTVHNVTEVAYDALDRKIRETVSKGTIVYTVTQYSYDDAGRLKCTAIRMNPDTFGSLPADACALGTSGSYGPDRITRNEYDAAGQLTKVIRAYGTNLQQDYATYSYTANGKREYVTDANGNKAQLKYDGHDRQSHWYFPSKTAAGTASTTDYEQYGYDANGNRTSLRKRDGVTLTYTFDALNRMASKTVPGGCASAAAGACASATGDLTVHYAYDLRGLQTVARFGSLGGQGIVNAFDGFGRMTSSTNSSGGVTRTLSYQYDAAGNRTRITHPDGTAFDYRYDGLDRPDKITDAAGNSLGIMVYYSTGRQGWFGYGATGVGYGYDPAGRLSGYTIQHNEGPPANVVLDQTVLEYSPASQITRQYRLTDAYAWSGAANVDRSYTVNGLNQYVSASSASYAYDANGNLTGSTAPEAPGGPAVTRSYSYDAENRLYASSDGVTLSYDPLGRLFQTAKAGGVTTQFLYDGSAMVAEYASDGTSRRYVHGAGDDTPLLVYTTTASGTTLRQLLADHQGSIIATAEHGWKIDRINSYDEYGLPASGNTGRFQYTGQAWVPELGMYYYKARMYAPRLGRFLQTDPIGYDDQINLYAYVGNDPVNNGDPSGTCTGSLISGKDGQCAGGGFTAGAGGCIGNCSADAAQVAIPARAAGVALGAGVEAGAAATGGVVASTLLLCGDSPSGCRSKEDYWYLTYTKQRTVGGRVVTYSGRTAGYGKTAEIVLQNRDRRHHMNAVGFGRASVDRAVRSVATINDIATRSAIRGREQMLIDHYGGARSQGGTSGNAINGIRPDNPLRPVYIGAAEAMFGNEF